MEKHDCRQNVAEWAELIVKKENKVNFLQCV